MRFALPGVAAPPAAPPGPAAERQAEALLSAPPFMLEAREGSRARLLAGVAGRLASFGETSAA